MRQSGFALIPFLLIIVLLSILGLVGFLNKDSLINSLPKASVPFMLQPKIIYEQNLENNNITKNANLYLKGNQIYVSSYYAPLLLEIDSTSGQVKRQMRIVEHIMSSDLSDNFFYYHTFEEKNNYIHALDISTGIEKWSQRIESFEEKYAQSFIKAANGKVYLNEGVNKVTALNGESGERIWSYEVKLSPDSLGSQLPLIEVGRSVVILNFNDGILYALDSMSGKELWHFDMPSFKSNKVLVVDNVRWPIETKNPRPDQVLVTDNMVYLSLNYNETSTYLVYALDNGTGQVKWQFYAVGNPHGSMAYHDEIFYFAKAYGYLQAIDSKDGKELWKIKIKTNYFPTNLTISDRLLYFGMEQSSGPTTVDNVYLYAVNRKTGKQMWEFKINDSISALRSANGIVYFVSSGGKLTAIK